MAAIAALVLLLLLLKKKKAPEYEESIEGTVESAEMQTDMPEYISEYGLSDGVSEVRDGDDPDDIPRGAADSGDSGDFRLYEGNASEHNPEEMEGFDNDAGE